MHVTAIDKEPPHTNQELYEKQMALLKTFLEHGAISQAQYDKSAGCLTEHFQRTKSDHKI